MDAADGRQLWALPGYAKGSNSPVVQGDELVHLAAEAPGLHYRLGATGAEKLGELAFASGSANSTPAWDRGRLLSYGAEGWIVLTMPSRATAWTGKGGGGHGSPVIAGDTALVSSGKQALALIDLASGVSLGEFRCGEMDCSSPALADGRLVVNATSHLRCFDLRRRADPATPAARVRHGGEGALSPAPSEGWGR